MNILSINPYGYLVAIVIAAIAIMLYLLKKGLVERPHSEEGSVLDISLRHHHPQIKEVVRMSASEMTNAEWNTDEKWIAHMKHLQETMPLKERQALYPAIKWDDEPSAGDDDKVCANRKDVVFTFRSAEREGWVYPSIDDFYVGDAVIDQEGVTHIATTSVLGEGGICFKFDTDINVKLKHRFRPIGFGVKDAIS